MTDPIRARREAEGRWTVRRMVDDLHEHPDVEEVPATVPAFCCNQRPVTPEECVKVTPDLRAVLDRVRGEYPWIETELVIDFDADYLCSSCVRNLKRRWPALGRRAVFDEPSFRAAIGAPSEIVERGRESVALRAHRANEVLTETREVLSERIGYEHRWPEPTDSQ